MHLEVDAAIPSGVASASATLLAARVSTGGCSQGSATCVFLFADALRSTLSLTSDLGITCLLYILSLCFLVLLCFAIHTSFFLHVLGLYMCSFIWFVFKIAFTMNSKHLFLYYIAGIFLGIIISKSKRNELVTGNITH